MLLKEIYNSILSNPDKWKYYSRMDINPTNCNVDYLFADEDNARRFIAKYFEEGNKLDVFSSTIGTQRNRWRHTLSVFIMGIYLCELLETDIVYEDKYLNKLNLYHWFLTCLYHDYGYVIENNPSDYPPRKLSIQKLFTDKLNGKQYLRFKNGECEFSDSVRWRYYDYCRNKRGFIDHGITGGLLLYNQLSEHLDKMIHDNGGQKDFVDSRTGLHYSIKHKKDFALCADAIIAHNIWFDQSDISELKLDDKERHIYKNWLTALLVLCDTIEPLKAFPCCPPISVLEHIDFSLCGDSLRIAGNNSHCNYSAYINKCASLQDWTYVSCKNHTTNGIRLNKFRKLYL